MPNPKTGSPVWPALVVVSLVAYFAFSQTVRAFMGEIAAGFGVLFR